MAETALDHENLLFPVATVSLQLSILNHNASIFTSLPAVWARVKEKCLDLYKRRVHNNN